MPKRTRAGTSSAKHEEKHKKNQLQQDEAHSPPKKPEEADENEETPNSTTTTFHLPYKKDKQIPCETREPASAPDNPTLIFTHGAGGTLASAAMVSFATGFSRHGRITSFQGNMNLTSRVGMFGAVVGYHQREYKGEEEEEGLVVLGGRSMGARAAVLAALEGIMDESGGIPALVLVSYPLTASKSGKQEREFERRERILLDLPEGVDVLFVSGSRDVQCDWEVLEGLRREMKAGSWIVEVRGADHGMGMVDKVGTEEMGELMGEVAARWVRGRDREKRFSELYWDGEEGKAVQAEWREDVSEDSVLQDGRKKRKAA